MAIEASHLYVGRCGQLSDQNNIQIGGEGCRCTEKWHLFVRNGQHTGGKGIRPGIGWTETNRWHIPSVHSKSNVRICNGSSGIVWHTESEWSREDSICLHLISLRFVRFCFRPPPNMFARNAPRHSLAMAIAIASWPPINLYSLSPNRREWHLWSLKLAKYHLPCIIWSDVSCVLTNNKYRRRSWDRQKCWKSVLMRVWCVWAVSTSDPSIISFFWLRISFVGKRFIRVWFTNCKKTHKSSDLLAPHLISLHLISAHMPHCLINIPVARYGYVRMHVQCHRSQFKSEIINTGTAFMTVSVDRVASGTTYFSFVCRKQWQIGTSKNKENCISTYVNVNVRFYRLSQAHSLSSVLTHTDDVRCSVFLLFVVYIFIAISLKLFIDATAVTFIDQSIHRRFVSHIFFARVRARGRVREITTNRNKQ